MCALIIQVLRALMQDVSSRPGWAKQCDTVFRRDKGGKKAQKVEHLLPSSMMSLTQNPHSWG